MTKDEDAVGRCRREGVILGQCGHRMGLVDCTWPLGVITGLKYDLHAAEP